jgi:aryl carrier-like protein
VEVESLNTKAEAIIAKIWSDLLKIPLDSIGRNTSFFDVGGDSISVIQFVSACQKAGLKIDVQTIYQTQTLARIAAHVSPKSESLMTSSALHEGKVAGIPSAITSSDKKYRVLCFHGYGTSGDIFDIQMQPIQSALKDVEFIFLDGPLPAKFSRKMNLIFVLIS